MLWLLLAGCPAPESTPVAREPVTIEAGAPVAGMAEGTLDFPMGTPMGGFTARCRFFGNAGRVDQRDTHYVESFSSTAGIQTRARAQVLWLENGQEDFVLAKVDVIYTPDHLVSELEERLTEATGRDMHGRVAIAASHTHNAPANWNRGVTWYLGGDRYNHEVHQRFATSLEELALEAFEARVPAAIGVGRAVDWDPDDLVYRDRRGENNEFPFFEDIGAGAYKDPTLTVLRVDTADGDPMGFFFAFGIHGTIMGEENALVTTEASGAVELALEDRFDEPLVVGHLQAGGGDLSPAGSDDHFARMETVGEYAADAILELWAETPTSSAPIDMETVTHSIDTDRANIRVTRDGTVDWSYPPYDEDMVPDGVVWVDDTTLDPTFDEFNTPYGAAFCGDEDPLIPGAGINTDAFPYESCVQVDTISVVLSSFFALEEGAVQLPLPESQRAQVTASKLGPLSIRDEDGSVVEDDVLLAFFPGETTSVYTEQFRRRAAAELGIEHAIPIGYAQDHEGYLLTPEDWLQGGYEPNINIWGPLQGEHIMEGVLEIGHRWLSTDIIEPQDPRGEWLPTDYPIDLELIEQIADATPAAGTVADTVPEEFFVPLEGLDAQVQPDLEIPRVQGIAQLVWEGGDPMVDLPTVVLERQLDDGSWEPVETPSGRLVSDTRPDILTAHTPDPFYPFVDEQSHTWWAGWQAVGAWDARMGAQLGIFRLHVSGHSMAGGVATWPYEAQEYTLTSEPFEVVPAEISVSLDGETLAASIAAPAWGYRLVDLDGHSQGANPVDGATLEWELDDGSIIEDSPTWSVSGGTAVATVSPPEGAVGLVVTDLHGNLGELAL